MKEDPLDRLIEWRERGGVKEEERGNLTIGSFINEEISNSGPGLGEVNSIEEINNAIQRVDNMAFQLSRKAIETKLKNLPVPTKGQTIGAHNILTGYRSRILKFLNELRADNVSYNEELYSNLTSSDPKLASVVRRRLKSLHVKISEHIEQMGISLEYIVKELNNLKP